MKIKISLVHLMVKFAKCFGCIAFKFPSNCFTLSKFGVISIIWIIAFKLFEIYVSYDLGNIINKIIDTYNFINFFNLK